MLTELVKIPASIYLDKRSVRAWNCEMIAIEHFHIV